ncbi:MAG TPA: class I SAM-dependent methyltransferase [Promineifilum sp.]|nr:class I SAM-dependent methyltransferase [Promineifilum sp.]HRO90468.1 class I SAM-dependent methyltransferase [Promineifilum sp.]HRQ14693.1 class I SAM-dependent methyltransferase [Promineifilum sp.]
MSEQDPTRRFTDRVENYARYRPGYPSALLECLREECGLTPGSVIADIGSGTGILTEMFLDNGNPVFAVEPNEAMRQSAEISLARYPGFTSVNGRAEATTLPSSSIDLVTAGQAFHWFDATASRIEFGRILRPGGYVALVWNARDHEEDPLMAAYEHVLGEFGMGYTTVTHRSHDGDLDTLFINGRKFRSFTHTRRMNFATLWGGFLSASYAPSPNDAIYEPMRAGLRSVFETYQHDGQVTFIYKTHLYFGQLTN